MAIAFFCGSRLNAYRVRIGLVRSGLIIVLGYRLREQGAEIAAKPDYSTAPRATPRQKIEFAVLFARPQSTARR